MAARKLEMVGIKGGTKLNEIKGRLNKTNG